ncbi:hypothetical protein FACS1894201_08010 [Bacteroidia bacterium]|nr:hypothetical protein FACS1894201_08010 [Bacteroidia bacterium]
MSDTYLSIAKLSTGIYKSKGSKFLAFAIPVSDEDSIKMQVTLLKKKYHDARHHCYAYIIGYQAEQFRVNDDGEPSGTAGRPIHGELRSRNLTNVLVVVVRYFGGTLLGTSGLIKAYKEAAADALNNAEIVQQTVMTELLVQFLYEKTGDVMKILKECNAGIVEHRADNLSVIRFNIRQSQTDNVLYRLSEVCENKGDRM